MIWHHKTKVIVALLLCASVFFPQLIWSIGPKVYGLKGAETLFVLPRCATMGKGVPVWWVSTPATPEVRKSIGGELIEILLVLPDIKPWCYDSEEKPVVNGQPSQLVKIFLLKDNEGVNVIHNILEGLRRGVSDGHWKRDGFESGLQRYVAISDQSGRVSEQYVPVEKWREPIVIQCLSRHLYCRGRLDFGEYSVIFNFSPQRLQEWEFIAQRVFDFLKQAKMAADYELSDNE